MTTWDDAAYCQLTPAQYAAWLRRISDYDSRRTRINYDRSARWYRRSRRTFSVSVGAAVFNLGYAGWNVWQLIHR